MLIHFATKAVTTIGRLDADGNVVQKTDLNWECAVLSKEAFEEILDALLRQKKAMEDQEAAQAAATVEAVAAATATSGDSQAS